MKKIVQGWELNDWDGDFSPTCQYVDGGLNSSLEIFGEHIRVEHESYNGGTETAIVPLEVLIEFLRMNGYDVVPKKKK